MKKKKNLLKFHRSRKAYLFLYFLVFSIIAVLVYLYFEGYPVSGLSVLISFLFICLVFYSIEILHRREWWAITDSALIHSIGILNKNVRDVDFESISDLDIDKPLFKRFLNYGTVNVRVFLSDTTIRVVDIPKPERFIDILEGRIRKSRRGKHVIRKT